MPYLIVNSTKSYLVTDSYNKPYIKISNSILPLTSNGGGVIRCKDNNGNTYRPLEYKSQSASATYYTSAVNSEGLSSTTALTRASTSDTSYETRASTSGTEYGTKEVNTVSYLSMSSFLHYSYESVITNKTESTISRQISERTEVLTAQITYFHANTTADYYASLNLRGNKKSRNYTDSSSRYSLSNNIVTNSTSFSSVSQQQSATSIEISTRLTLYNTLHTTDNSRLTESGSFDSVAKIFYYSGTSSNLANGGINGYTRYSTFISYYTINSNPKITQTTGTTYLTRSSTSNTIYLTRSSTSGYSGVSSSSSESSGWE